MTVDIQKLMTRKELEALRFVFLEECKDALIVTIPYHGKVTRFIYHETNWESGLYERDKMSFFTDDAARAYIMEN